MNTCAVPNTGQKCLWCHPNAICHSWVPRAVLQASCDKLYHTCTWQSTFWKPLGNWRPLVWKDLKICRWQWILMPHKFPGNCPYLFFLLTYLCISSFLKGVGKEKSQVWTILTLCKCCENKLETFSTWIFLSYSLVRALLCSMLFSTLLGTSITQIIKKSHTKFFSTRMFLWCREWDGLRTPNSD